MLINEHRANIYPHVTPCWRWETAQRLSVDGSGDHADEIILDTAAYLRSSDQKTFPKIYLAHDIFESDGFLRAEIEARILAKQSNEQIAEHNDITPDTIAIYHDLFFSVRDIEANDWILMHAVGRCHQRGFRCGEARELLAWLAIFAGSFVTDVVLSAIKPLHKPEDKVSVLLLLSDEVGLPEQLQSFIASKVIPFDQEGHQYSISLAPRIQQIDKASDVELKRHAMSALRRDLIIAARRSLEGQPFHQQRETMEPTTLSRTTPHSRSARSPKETIFQ